MRGRERVTHRDREGERKQDRHERSANTERTGAYGRGRERLRVRHERSAREHSLFRDHNLYQRNVGGRQHRRWRSRGERGISEHRGWHNKNEKEDSYDKDGNWTKVTSKRSAKERKKKISEKRSPDKHVTWREPTYHQPNWRNKDDITSFYFTHFADDVTEVRLWKNFKKWEDVREVYIAKRRNKDGRRYGFVRFKGVSDAKRLEV